MKNTTRVLYSLLLSRIATAYDASDVTKKFSVSTPMETKLNDAVQMSSSFLQMITMTGVDDSKGQALNLEVAAMLAKRTDVSAGARQPNMYGGPDGTQYETKLTEFDVGIDYTILDQFARFKDFAQRYMVAVFRAIALSRISVGWNGTSASAVTSSGSNPLGQDVNVGWLELIKTTAGANFMDDAGGGVVRIHESVTGGLGYKSVDGAVADLYSSIAIEHRTGNEVAIIGSDILAMDSNKVYNDHGTTPTEKNEIKTMLNTHGGLPTLQVPKFPTKGIFVGDPMHLHLYYQEGKTRRHTEEESNRNRVVDYISSNDAYAIGNIKGVAAVDHTKVVLTAAA